MTTVSDSSPLISLAAIGKLELLQSVFNAVVIPQAIYAENTAGKDRPGAQEIIGSSWIQAGKIKSEHSVIQLMKSGNLHVGESEAIVLANELKATDVILDDHAARKAARRRHVPVIGTLGVLLLAKDSKLIPAVEPCLQALLAAGKYIDPVTYRDILIKAGEI